MSSRYIKPKAVRELEQAVYDAKVMEVKARCPEIQTLAHIVKPSFRDDTANDLTKCILTYIRLLKGQAERINTMGRPIDHRKTFIDVIGRTRTIGSVEWGKGHTTKGSADISATVNGQTVKIEVKIGRDRQSNAQKAYQKSIEAAGGIYYIAPDFTTFKTWFDGKFGHDE